MKNLPRPLRLWLNKYFVFRPGIIYAFSCIDPITGKRESWAYVGQTRQQLISRYNQHMGLDARQPAQPWSDLYPEIRVVWEGKCPDRILNLLEKHFIKRHRAVYNYIHNTRNPRRIPKYEALAQRHQRDLRRGRRRGKVLR